MASPGFRQPQFSEDIAWLPAWIQPHHMQPLDGDNGPQTPEQACKDSVFLQVSASEGKDEILFAKGDIRYNSFHLFLSGDDCSPIGLTPTTENLPHFHLHLSSDGISENIQSPAAYILLSEKHESNNNLPQHILPETEVVLDDQACHYKIDDITCIKNLIPSISKARMSQTSKLQSCTKGSRNEGRKDEKKFNARQLRNADIKDAVEHSIAASEALVISELVESGSPSEILPAATVLEVALQVKQARNHLCLDGVDEASICSTENVDETDLLLDLDDDYMADAFNDVGLSSMKVVGASDDMCGCSSVIKQATSSARLFSYVLETPISENNYTCNSEVQRIEVPQEVDFNGISRQKFEDTLPVDLRGSKNSPLESPGDALGKYHYHNPPLGPSSILSIHRDLDLSVAIQGVDHDIADIDSSQDLKSGKLGTGNEILDVVPDRFRSRWLGGWTGKDNDASMNLERNKLTKICKPFVGETSFLSESADVAPDESSCVQKLEIAPCVASFSSIPFEEMCNTVNEGTVLSQDLVRSSSLSLVDPLCSIVPCSISSEQADVILAQDKEDGGAKTGKCSNPTSGTGLGNSQRTPEPNVEHVEFAYQEGLISKVNSEGFRDTGSRRLTSLKTYSMVVPVQNVSSINENIYSKKSFSLEGVMGFPTSEENVDCLKYHNDESTPLLPSKPKTKHTGDDIRDPANVKLIKETAGERGDSNEITNEVRHEITNDGLDLQVHPQEARGSPIILNYGCHCRLQASKFITRNIAGEVNFERVSIPEWTEPHNLVGSGDQSNFTPILHTKPHEGQGLTRKRVRFFEAEVEFQRSKSSPKLQSGNRNRSINRAGKRWNGSIARFDAKAREKNKHFTDIHIKFGRRIIFHGLEFLLTGFSSQKEKELEMLIRNHGGVVLSDIPLPCLNLRRNRRARCKLQQLPVVLSPKKLQTTKFLYGCAVNAFLLKTRWLTDSVKTGSILRPDKYMILPHQANARSKRIGQPIYGNNITYIFDKMGIMLHGKHSFCTKLEKIVKHGGGQIFKTLQWLVQSLKTGKNSVGAIVAEDEGKASRHLRHCALEEKLPMVPASWLIKSLHLGKLLPFTEIDQSSALSTTKIPDYRTTLEFSEEI
ncbi:uncharacterized protein LOC122643968 isoform X1 [Telopea speciosissima]|uniref:uncharacterized protein LOC122643968 isoform X1 n=1 Tax=Telopea speciosissima TaxID=54955 RepID=UPI001CC82F0A|nr:uncharacterized protein LOC122643968 isoform X1 [Telopea speciosissima]XP_043693486.1 uncharacterized protein LOC122643968 isoform X1 [Telopea speciosissima]